MVELILFLILFPFLAAVILAVARSQAARRIIVPICGILIIIAAIAFAVQWLPAIGVFGAMGGGTGIMLVTEAHVVDMVMLIGEVVLLVVILAFSFKYKRYFCVVLSVVQFLIMLVVDLVMDKPEVYQLNIDRLTVIMVLIVGIVGILGAGALSLMGAHIGMLYVGGILAIVSGIIELMAGLRGNKYCKDPVMGAKCLPWGVLVAVLSIISQIISCAGGSKFSVVGLIVGLIIPILYIALAWILSCQMKRRRTFRTDHCSP